MIRRTPGIAKIENEMAREIIRHSFGSIGRWSAKEEYRVETTEDGTERLLTYRGDVLFENSPLNASWLEHDWITPRRVLEAARRGEI